MGWPPTENISPPPISNRWQEELTRIGGCAPNGLPMLRLVWGQTATFTKDCRNLRYLHHKQKRLTGWTIDIRNDKDEFIETHSFAPTLVAPQIEDLPAGLYASAPYPVYTPEEIGVPRWLIEQYLPPERLGDWDTARQHFEMEHGFDGMGPFPADGFYWFAFHCIANHEGACCKRADIEDQRCFGGANGYRKPTELDLQYVAALWQCNTNDIYRYHWTEAPTQDAIAQRTLEMFNVKQDQLQKEREQNRDRIRESLKPSRRRLQEGSGLDLYTYHDLGKALEQIRKNRNDPDAVTIGRSGHKDGVQVVTDRELRRRANPERAKTLAATQGRMLVERVK